MSVKKVYSPTQAALGSFIGGPIGSFYFIKQNFKILGRENAIKKTTTIGGIVIIVFLLILPFIPENLPNFLIPFFTIIITRLIVEKYQFNKGMIIADETLAFHSNWRVFFIGVIALLITLVLIAFVLVLFAMLGIAAVE